MSLTFFDLAFLLLLLSLLVVEVEVEAEVLVDLLLVSFLPMVDISVLYLEWLNENNKK